MLQKKVYDKLQRISCLNDNKLDYDPRSLVQALAESSRKSVTMEALPLSLIAQRKPSRSSVRKIDQNLQISLHSSIGESGTLNDGEEDSAVRVSISNLNSALYVKELDIENQFNGK